MRDTEDVTAAGVTDEAPTSRRRKAPDALCAAAVELARTAAEEVAAGDSGALTTTDPVVGEHIGASAEGERVVVHRFASNATGYRGWQWAVTVARASRAKRVTVDEVVLLPGPQALLPPPWVPWSERLRPGDLRVGDLLPTAVDDDRLAPAYLLSDDPAVEQVAVELGLGRVRVLSRLGRLEAAQRWYDGPSGPQSAIAQAAPAPCGTCGFYLPVAGSLRAVVGVCANEFAPDDGRVVTADHGCGAHSEAVVAGPVAELVPPPPPVLDDGEFELVPRVAEHSPGSVSDSETGEPLGHS